MEDYLAKFQEITDELHEEYGFKRVDKEIIYLKIIEKFHVIRDETIKRYLLLLENYGYLLAVDPDRQCFRVNKEKITGVETYG